MYGANYPDFLVVMIHFADAASALRFLQLIGQAVLVYLPTFDTLDDLEACSAASAYCQDHCCLVNASVHCDMLLTLILIDNNVGIVPSEYLG